MFIGLRWNNNIYLTFRIYSRVLSQEKDLNKQGNSICYLLHLNDQQLKACLSEPRILFYVGKGTSTGMAECQRQFHNERWNCSSGSYNSKLYKKGTPEAAYVSAISSAGVVSRITHECDKGVVKNCGCKQNSKNHHKFLIANKRDKPYVWSLCDDHLRYSMKITKTFLDPSREETFVDKRQRSIKKLIIIQNNKASRKMIYTLSKNHKKCACHGPSGQCISKICYRWLPELKVIAHNLYKKYQTAVKVKLKNGRKLVSSENKKLEKTDLVYTERLSYCNKVDSLGIPGTQHRVCSNHKPLSSDDMTSCDILCCERGYNMIVRKKRYRCRCKFVWCCDAKCEWCETTVYEHRCK